MFTTTSDTPGDPAGQALAAITDEELTALIAPAGGTFC